jgi:Flp pilus assembly protein TadD
MAIGLASDDAAAAMGKDGKMIIVPDYVEAEKRITSGDLNGAIGLLQSTIRYYPGHASAWNLLGYVHRRLGKFDAAEKYYDAALTVNPNHIGALNYMGQLFIQTGRPEKAKALVVRLKTACKSGCKELDELQKAVDTGIAGKY